MLGIIVYMQRKPHHPCPVRIARKPGHLAVGRDLASRNLTDNIIDPLEAVFFVVFPALFRIYRLMILD